MSEEDKVAEKEEKDERDFLMYALKGNESAVDFCQTLFRISQIADDLYDQDRPVKKEDVEECFWRCLIQLPSQPFYANNFSVLQPAIQNAFVCWLTANSLEQGSEHDKSIAFVLRDEVGAIAITVAYLVGGYLWGKKVAPEMRRRIHDESFNSYAEGLKR